MGKAPPPHAFKPGVPRPPHAGRKKGTPNKKTVEFQKLLEERNFSPGEALLDLYVEQMKLYELRRERHPYHLVGAATMLEKAGVTLNNICQYVYPKKKAIEHSGEVGIKTFADFMLAAKPGRK